jgi:hypothetical protein
MNEVSSWQVRRVQKYSAYGRFACSVLMVLLLISVGVVLLALFKEGGTGRLSFVIGGMKIAADRAGNAVATAWLLTIISAGLVCSAALIWMLRRMFDNFAHGRIFHAENVRQIRHIAFVVLLIGVGKILLLVGTLVLASHGLFESANVAIVSGFDLPLTPFWVAGILYLASWIMQVGLGVSDEAAALQRDAELVI